MLSYPLCFCPKMKIKSNFYQGYFESKRVTALSKMLMFLNSILFVVFICVKFLEHVLNKISMAVVEIFV
jgi:hypothetical protein